MNAAAAEIAEVVRELDKRMGMMVKVKIRFGE